MSRTAQNRLARISLVKLLYERLANNTLQADDILASEDAIYEDIGPFLRSIYSDYSLFAKHFSDFLPTYDIFRVFGVDDVILDVGSHWGYSALAIRRQGSLAKIVSIEAIKQNTIALEVLKELEAGRYDYVECAATEVASELEFYIPAMNGVANTGSSSTGGTLSGHFAFILADLASTYPAKEGQQDRVQLITQRIHGRQIDEIAKSLEIFDSVKAIKMDIEGHEFSALKGANELIDKQRPLIMVEGANRDSGVVSEMKKHNYLHYERHSGRLVSHSKQSIANDGFWLHSDKIHYYRKIGLI
jgi:FkbM family methyltransferase